MTWSLATDGFYDYLPDTATEIFYIAETGNNATATVNNKSLPWRTTNTTRTFTVSGANAKRGARYQSANGLPYYVVDTIAGGSSLLCIECGGGGTTPTTPLSLLDGGGGISDTSIVFSAVGSEVNGAVRAFEALHGGGGTQNISLPAWFLFRMGDFFEHQSLETRVNDNFTHMGSGYTSPLIVGSYDPSIFQTTSWNGGAQFCTVNPKTSVLAKPKFTPNSYAGGNTCFIHTSGGGGSVASDFGLGNGGNNMVVVGLESDGASIGDHFIVTAQQPISFFRMEDLRVYDWGQISSASGEYHRCSLSGAGQGPEVGGLPLALYDINGLGTLAKFKECTLDDNGASGFDHQIYGGTDANPWFGMDPGPIVLQGNIFSRTISDIQVRSGGTIDNNALIANETDIPALGCAIDATTTVSNNVSLHCVSGTFIAGMNNMQYISNRQNHGIATLTNNIVAHETGNMQSGIHITSAARGWTYSNNLFYKICASSGTPVVTPTAGGIICHGGTITSQGSSYTDKTFTVTALSTTGKTSGSGAQRRVVPTVTISDCTLWPWTDTYVSGNLVAQHGREGWVVLGDFTFPFDVLNGRICRVYAAVQTVNGVHQTGAATIQLNGNFPEIDPAVIGSYSANGGKLYVPYLSRQFTNPHNGEVFLADVYVKGGQVVALREGTDADDNWVQSPVGQPGDGYQINDSLALAGTLYRFSGFSTTGVKGNTYNNNGQTFTYRTSISKIAGDFLIFTGTGAPSASGTLTGSPSNITFTGSSTHTDGAGINIGAMPGGSGFTFRVDEIETHTDGGGNVSDTTGATAGSYLAPERTDATYYNEVILGHTGAGAGGHTDGDFIAAALGQRRQNWNRLLMAESRNDYIRQGFGQTMVGSAYADTQNGGTPPTQVLMPQICM